MKILFATSECAPFSKSGGLADVAYSLPPALKAGGDDVEIVTPYYKCAKDRFGDKIEHVRNFDVEFTGYTRTVGLFKGDNCGVTVWFVDYTDFYGRDKLYGYGDDPYRFGFFSRCILVLLEQKILTTDILHCNDWETAPVMMYLADSRKYFQHLERIKTVYTIHNMAYQGQYARSEMYSTFGLGNDWYDAALRYNYEGREDMNLMKGAMLLADAVSTVSPNYARELHYPEYGHGLQGVVDMVEGKLYGILNGLDMDLYNPQKDTRIVANFSPEDLTGKWICKRHIQEKFGLLQEYEWPLLSVVARLTEQKGIEIIKEALPGLMDLGIQLIVFGQGSQEYVDYFNEMVKRYPGQLGFSDNYNDQVASEIFAGSDFYLMPSRFEPCGLSQMMAMRYGTVPIVRETGGLKDSVRPYSDFDGIGDGFSFSEYTSKALYLTIYQAIRLYFADHNKFNELRCRCMKKDFSWTKSAGQYDVMYGEIFGGEIEVDSSLTFEEAFAQLSKAYKEIDEANRANFPEVVRDDYRRAVEISIVGPGAGKLFMIFTGKEFRIEPYEYQNADAYVECDFESLMRMLRRETTFGKLYLSGQLKISGNLAQAFELKNLLAKKESWDYEG
ncbi:MAG: glycogen/starch synthase [Parasporobacterium sp.]|nr:glycogen/starch synthase [Parasporobacterium sp.]